MRKMGCDRGRSLNRQASLAAAAQASQREQPAVRIHETRSDVR